MPERCARKDPGSPRSPAPGAGESLLWALSRAAEGGGGLASISASPALGEASRWGTGPLLSVPSIPLHSTCSHLHKHGHPRAHTCTHLHPRAHTCTHMHPLVHTCTHAHTHTPMCTPAPMCPHLHTRAPTCAHLHPRAHTCTHAPMCTHLHPRTHTHTHVHTCTHVYTNLHPRAHTGTRVHTLANSKHLVRLGAAAGQQAGLGSLLGCPLKGDLERFNFYFGQRGGAPARFHRRPHPACPGAGLPTWSEPCAVGGGRAQLESDITGHGLQSGASGEGCGGSIS